MPLAYPGRRRHRRRAPGRPHRRRHLRRQPPRQGLGHRAGRARVPELRADERSLPRSSPGPRSTRCAAPSPAASIDDLIAYVNADDDVFLVPNAANTDRLARLAQAGGSGRRRGPRPAPRLRGHRGPGSAVAAAAGRPRPAGRPRVHVARARRVEGRAAHRLPVRLHRRARLRAAAALGRGRRTLGCARRRRRRCRAVSARATRCAPRWAIRCTARTCRPTSARSPRGSAGRWAGRSRRSGDARRCWPSAPRPTRLLWGLRVSSGIARPGMAVSDPSGRVSGTVTSGTFSPTLGAGIALAVLTGAERGRRGERRRARPRRSRRRSSGRRSWRRLRADRCPCRVSAARPATGSPSRTGRPGRRSR